MTNKRDQGGQSQDQAEAQKRQRGADIDSKGKETAGMGKDGAMRDQTNDKGQRSGAEKGSRDSST